MRDVILFWMLKPVAELLLILLIIGVGFVGCYSAAVVQCLWRRWRVK